MGVRGGRYELLSLIASGGMATVHLGRVLGAGGFERLVAIKVMHPHLASEPEFVAMFFDEARLAARIHHRNVVATLDIQEDEEGLFLVMEYVQGPSLHQVLRTLAQRALPLPLHVALRIFLDALAGLHAAHELCGPQGEPLNLVHRDVSPQNVLIGADGVAKITDFGVARAESRLQTTRTGVLKGKVGYMAPEQVRSAPLDRRADVYAAGALLWQVLTGERLVPSENEVVMIQRILAGKWRAPREVRSTVPDAVSAACMKALAWSPSDRFPTAAAFAQAVEEAAAAAGVAIAKPGEVAAFVKSLDGAERQPTRSDAPPISTPPPPEATETTTLPAISSPPHAREVTTAAVLAPSEEWTARHAGSLRRVGAAAALFVGGGVSWLVFTRPAPATSSLEAEPAASTVAEAAQPPPPSSSSVVAATPPPSAAPPAPPSAAPAATASAASASARRARTTPHARGPSRVDGTSPTSFRPTEP